MNFSFQFPVFVRWFCSDWTLFINIRSCFFVVAFIKKKNLAIIIYNVYRLSGNDAKKCYLRCVARKWLVGFACKKINSSENCVLGWISLQSCSYFLRNRALVSSLTLTLKQTSLRKKIDPNPDPEFY